jgi:hypothetical protein
MVWGHKDGIGSNVYGLLKTTRLEKIDLTFSLFDNMPLKFLFGGGGDTKT